MSVDLSIDMGERLGMSRSDLSRTAFNQIQDRITEARNELRTFLLEVWPVLSGASLQEWELRVAGLIFIVRNPIDYVEFVHRAGEDVLVWTEIEQRAEELATEMLPDLIAIAQRHPKKVAAPSAVLKPSATDLITGALFRAKRRALAAVPISIRDRRLLNLGGRRRRRTRGS